MIYANKKLDIVHRKSIIHHIAFSSLFSHPVDIKHEKNNDRKVNPIATITVRKEYIKLSDLVNDFPYSFKNSSSLNAFIISVVLRV